jgi:hypothetical protein
MAAGKPLTKYFIAKSRKSSENLNCGDWNNLRLDCYVMKNIIILLLLLGLAGCETKDWRTASRKSSGLAPKPAVTRDAVIEVYGASTWGWRGWFAIHTWIATKPTNGDAYTVYEVVGWRQRRGLPAMRIEKDLPDRYWYGEKPRLIKEVKGKGVDQLIAAVDRAAKSYPWPDTYTAFPGPNSNTFIAWIAKQVPELGLELPISAIGSGYVSSAIR